MKGAQLEQKIEKQLGDAGFKFHRQPAIGGLRPDFLIEGPRGQLVVVEAKPWHSRGGNTARALEQVTSYEKATGADRVFLVLPDLRRDFHARGVIKPDSLVPTLKRLFEEWTAAPRRKKTKSSRGTRIVFAAMPFDREYDDTYFVAMSHAAEKVGAARKRVDRTEFTGDIVEEIKRLIRESIAVIVDLSDAKPNVLYEAGYAHALRKPAVHICSTLLSGLPFDVRNWNTLEYHRGQTAKLREPLSRRLRAAVN